MSSPHEMGRHIVFSSFVCLSVCLSVTLRVGSISFKPLVIFTNYSAQLSRMMRWCAVPMFDQCQFKVKVNSKIKHCMTVFYVRSISFEPLVGFTNNFAQMSSMMRQCAVPMFDQGQFKVKVNLKIKHCMTVFHVCSISFEPLVGFTNNFAQMSSMMRQCAVPMLDQGRFKVKVTI